MLNARHFIRAHVSAQNGDFCTADAGWFRTDFYTVFYRLTQEGQALFRTVGSLVVLTGQVFPDNLRVAL